MTRGDAQEKLSAIGAAFIGLAVLKKTHEVSSPPGLSCFVKLGEGDFVRVDFDVPPSDDELDRIASALGGSLEEQAREA